MCKNIETALPRYISSEKLINIINPKGLNNPLVRLQDIMRAIAMTPTEDVAPMVHAHWKQVSEKYPRYVCTACNHLFNNKGFKYCPFCGAKMDEGTKK